MVCQEEIETRDHVPHTQGLAWLKRFEHFGRDRSTMGVERCCIAARRDDFQQFRHQPMQRRPLITMVADGDAPRGTDERVGRFDEVRGNAQSRIADPLAEEENAVGLLHDARVGGGLTVPRYVPRYCG